MLLTQCPICARTIGLPALHCIATVGDVIAPVRLVAGWADLSGTEQLAMLSLISAALQDVAPLIQPDPI